MTEYKRPIMDKVTIDGNLVPVFITTGNYYLRKNPFTTNTYTGTYSDGVWNFGTVEDGEYEIWNATSKLINYGRFWIGDTSPTLENPVISGLLTLSGGILQDSLSCAGQAIFLSSVAFDKSGGVGNDLARINQVQCNKLVEYVSGGGITVDGILLKDDLETSNITSLTELNTRIGGVTSSLSAYLPLSSSQAHHVYTATNFHNPIVFSYITPPAILGVPTSPNHAINYGYFDSELTARFNTFASNGYQESLNIVRLIPNGTEQTGKVYNDWGKALDYCSATGSTSASSTHRYTIKISGAGNSYKYVIPTPKSGTSDIYNADFVDLKGDGAEVGIEIVDEMSLSASVLGNHIISDLLLYFALNNNYYYKEVFRNVRMFNDGATYTTNPISTFTDCYFDYVNMDSTYDNAFQLINCTGIVITKKPIIVSGTNKPLIIYDDGTNINIDNRNLNLTGNMNFTGTLNTDEINVGNTTLTGDGSSLYIGGELITLAGSTIGGETKINGRLNATGDVNFVSSTITEKASGTLGLSGTTVSISGTLQLNQTPDSGTLTCDKFIEFKDASGATYRIPVQEKI